MLFPVSGVETSFFLPPLAAFAVSLVCSVGGISGAFLLLPFQVSFLGYTAPSVSATNQVFNIFATPGGVIRYIREGRMLWPLALSIAAGTLPGVFIGAWVRARYLPDPASFRVFAGAVLLVIGLRMLVGKSRAKGGTSGAMTAVQVTHRSLSSFSYTFQGETYSVATVPLFLLSLVIGVAGGTYGIGGGAIMSPVLAACFGLPVHTIAGATLFGTFLTSIAGVAFYTVLAPLFPGLNLAPDWLLGLSLGLGGFAGMYTGARLQKFIPAKAIRALLFLVIMGTSLRYLLF